MPKKRWRWIVRSVCLWIALIPASVSGQEDSYHLWLRTHLDQVYGVTGGTWTFADQEGATLALAMPTGVQTQLFVPSGQEFGRGLRITAASASANPWDRTVRFRNQEAIQANDVLLLVVWLRHTWPAGETGLVGPVFELAGSPYTKSLESSYAFDDGNWELFMLPFTAVIDYGVQGGHFQLNLGYQRQIVELGGLALLNYGTSIDLGALPKVIPAGTYQGRDPSAPWRAVAAQRIDQYRKGTVQVLVQDGDGQPVSGAPVRVRMTRHQFGFGTAVAVNRMVGSGFNPTYRNKLADLTGDGRGFNWAVLENSLKWPQWESNWPASKSEKVGVVRWLRDRDIEVRGHVLVWPRWESLPSDLQANQGNPAYVTERIENHIAEIAGHEGLKGVLHDWDVINEPTHETDLRDLYAETPGYVTGEEVYAEWFELAAVADPDARLFINDYSIISTYGAATVARTYYKKLISDLLQAGAPLHGIGVQGHMGIPLTPPDTLYKVYEELAAFGVPISVTEYDAADVEEELAADYLRDFLTVTYSHPGVQSFLMWGFWDGAHWFGDAPIFRSDWSLKPSGQAFLDLVFNEWWTDVEGVTDEAGSFETGAFLGSYEVSATVDGTVIVQEGSLDAAGAQLPVTVLATGVDRSTGFYNFAAGDNYPDPFVTKTTIPYSLARPSHVRLEVFDVTGRKVRDQNVGFQAPGIGQVTFEAGHLPVGLYFYCVTATGERSTGRMFHLGG